VTIDFTGKTVLITGASRGIGCAAAILFAEHGAHIAANYHQNEQAADSLLDDLSQFGVTARTYRADVADPRAVDHLIAQAVEDFGRLDVLVNNAGIWTEAPLASMTDAQLEQMLAVNLKSIFYCTRAALPHLQQTKGAVVNISSTAGQRGEALHSHYAATKGAVISATKSWATELAPDGIRVNCVAPGWVDTDMSHNALTEPDADKHVSLIPMDRPAQAEELAGAIVFLASDWASFITGEILNVNGGAVLCG
jgi:3-oxoacyl-[acyl-carrier protein] reductase